MVSKRSTAVRSLLALFTIVSTGGCGDEPKSTLEVEVFDVADFCEATLEVLCERQIACNVALINEATEVAGCVRDADVWCAVDLTLAAASVEADNALFDSSALVACRRELQLATCRELAAGARPAACSRVFVGDVAVGGACYTDVECEGESRCANAGTCPGSCVALEPDEIEVFDCRLSPCPDGQYCEGARCSDVLGQGSECRQDDACAEFYFCGKDVGEPDLRCRVKKGRAQTCFSRAACKDGLACRVVGPGNERTCQDPVAEGSPCVDAHECDLGLVCTEAGRCEPLRGEGEACAVGECQPGFYCWERGEVAAPECWALGVIAIAEDGACNPDFDVCGLGLYCRATAPNKYGTCALMPVVGESCADFTQGLFETCREGLCVSLDAALVCSSVRAPGEACELAEQCVTGSCVDGVCAAVEIVSCQPG